MQSLGDRVIVPVAELFQSPKAQRMTIAQPRAIQFLVVEHNLLIYQIEQAHLFFIQFLDDAGPNPHSFLKIRRLPP